LNEIVVTTVADSGTDPGEKLPESCLVIGFGFSKPLAGDLNVEILGAREAKNGW
jgi:hypothetical protein